MELHKSWNQIQNRIKVVEPIIIKSKQRLKNMITPNVIYNYFSLIHKVKKRQDNTNKLIMRQKLVQAHIVVKNNKLQICKRPNNDDITILLPEEIQPNIP